MAFTLPGKEFLVDEEEKNSNDTEYALFLLLFSLLQADLPKDFSWWFTYPEGRLVA